MDEKAPLTPEEEAMVNASGEVMFTEADRREYRRDQEKKVAALTAPAPRSAREMRVEVERLCKKWAYSPIEALIAIASDPPKDDEGRPLLGLDDIIGIHKMLLPYVAPQMSSVRVSDNTGGNTLVRINQLQFTPERRAGTVAVAPVADNSNNDIGDAWKETVARKTAVELLQQTSKLPHDKLKVSVPLPEPTVPVDPPEPIRAATTQSLADPESKEWIQ